MSRHEPLSAFLDHERLPVAMLPKELQLPLDAGEDNVQPFGLAVHDMVAVLDRDREKIGRLMVTAIQLDEVGKRVVVFQFPSSNAYVHLTDRQLAILEREKRFYPQERLLPGKLPKSNIGLTPEEEEQARWMLGYISAITTAAGGASLGIGAGLMMTAAARHAAEIGDAAPPCYTTLSKYLGRYLTQPYNLLRALLPAKSTGNKIKKFPPAFEQLVKKCVVRTWKQYGGNWQTLKKMVLIELKEPENEGLRNSVIDGDGYLLMSDRTLQRRLAAVDRFTRTFYRMGISTAHKHFPLHNRYPLPDAALDEVEVDYTEVDMFVFDDRFAHVYGKPTIILFRDRKTGCILGFSIFFGSGSLEAFVEGLYQAVYPKDMHAYPGLSWPQYGLPVCLVFDNEKHLVSDEMRFICDELDIHVRGLRPGEGWGKGGVEQMFNVLNTNVFHNLGGSTFGNPNRSKDMEDKGGNTPILSLSQLERFITAYICGEYHRYPVAGLGLTRLMSEVPEKLWEESIGKVRMRRPVNPDVFLRLGSRRRDDITIQDGRIRWDHVSYFSPQLRFLSHDQEHIQGKKGRETTRYVGYRPFRDIGDIILIDPYGGREIVVPVSEADKKYARGLREYQHLAAIKHYNKHNNRAGNRPIHDMSQLQKALNQHGALLEELYDRQKKQGDAQRLLAWHAQLSRREKSSRIVDVAYSPAASSELMDFNDPFAPPPAVSTSTAVAQTNPPGTPATIYVGNPGELLSEGDPHEEEMKRRRRKKDVASEGKIGQPKRSRRKPEPEDIHDEDLATLRARYKKKETK